MAVRSFVLLHSVSPTIERRVELKPALTTVPYASGRGTVSPVRVDSYSLRKVSPLPRWLLLVLSGTTLRTSSIARPGYLTLYGVPRGIFTKIFLLLLFLFFVFGIPDSVPRAISTRVFVLFLLFSVFGLERTKQSWLGPPVQFLDPSRGRRTEGEVIAGSCSRPFLSLSRSRAGRTCPGAFYRTETLRDTLQERQVRKAIDGLVRGMPMSSCFKCSFKAQRHLRTFQNDERWMSALPTVSGTAWTCLLGPPATSDLTSA